MSFLPGRAQAPAGCPQRPRARALGCEGKPGAAEGTQGQHLTAIVRCGSRGTEGLPW